MAAPRRVAGHPPGSIASTWLGLQSAASPKGVLTVEHNLPFFVIYNSDTAAHTLTLRGIGSSGGAAVASIPVSLPAGAWLTVPSSLFDQVEDGTVNGTVYGFPSDVPITGPKPAAGSGAATVPNSNLPNFNPNADGTNLMAGWGSTLKITPLKSGIVMVQVSGNFLANVLNNQVTLTARFGTGSAPAQNAAPTGTAVNIGGLVIENYVATVKEAFQLVFIVSGLTIGTAYWFDIQAIFTTAASDAIQNANGSVCELPW